MVFSFLVSLPVDDGQGMGLGRGHNHLHCINKHQCGRWFMRKGFLVCRSGHNIVTSCGLILYSRSYVPIGAHQLLLECSFGKGKCSLITPSDHIPLRPAALTYQGWCPSVEVIMISKIAPIPVRSSSIGGAPASRKDSELLPMDDVSGVATWLIAR